MKDRFQFYLMCAIVLVAWALLYSVAYAETPGDRVKFYALKRALLLDCPAAAAGEVPGSPESERLRAATFGIGNTVFSRGRDWLSTKTIDRMRMTLAELRQEAGWIHPVPAWDACPYGWTSRREDEVTERVKEGR